MNQMERRYSRRPNRQPNRTPQRRMSWRELDEAFKKSELSQDLNDAYNNFMDITDAMKELDSVLFSKRNGLVDSQLAETKEAVFELLELSNKTKRNFANILRLLNL